VRPRRSFAEWLEDTAVLLGCAVIIAPFAFVTIAPVFV
jgi:hypothetical protein